MLGEKAASAGCSAATSAAFVLAVNEACMNVIVHAYGGDTTKSFQVRLEKRAGDLVCRIEDSAPAADLSAIRPRELSALRPGGLGTHFMREILDECQYGHLPEGLGNFVEMKKKIS